MSLPHAATILVVDDSPEDRHTYRAFLREDKDRSYTFLEADSAEEGLRLLQRAQVDLILLDFELPDLDGLDFLRRLRDDHPDSLTPVVMITGRGSENIAVQALKAGASDYLVKSAVTPESLYRATRNAMEKADLGARLAKETYEREQAEEDLRDSESRFRMMVESVKDYAIVMLDPDGRISSWNEGARRVFGFHDREILGQHLRRLFTQEDSRARKPELELKRAAEQESASDTWWQVRKDGSRFYADGSLFAVRDSAGALRGFSAVVRDVSELRQTTLQLKEALGVRDEFLAVAAHELKTPITGILLKQQGLLRALVKSEGKEPDAQRLRTTLQQLSAQTIRLGALVESLLDVSRLSLTPAALDPQPLALGAFVREVVEGRADRFNAIREHLSVDVRNEVVGKWDRRRLEQVLLNLLNNAAKYAPGKPVRIQVSRERDDAVIAVTDQGPGIPKGDLNRIFERFERASPHSSTTGLGLGLYLSRHILQAFGGTLRVDSVVGQGTTFTIELPIGDPRDNAGATAGV